MAHANEQPFYHIQYNTDISDELFVGIPNNIRTAYKLTYINYYENSPPIWTPGIVNQRLRDSLRRVIRSIKLIRKEDNKEMGHFTIEGLGRLQDDGTYESFGTGYTNHMTISIHRSLQGKKLSTVLLRGMIKGIEAEGISIDSIKDQKLFIDADASGGFWATIGMVDNPYGSEYNGNENNVPVEEREGRGYDMKTTMGGILVYVSKTPMRNIQTPITKSPNPRSTKKEGKKEETIKK